MRKIYLASPFFSEKELVVYKEVIELLRALKDTEVYVPMEHEIKNGTEIENYVWAERVFALDRKALCESDYVFVLNFGMYSDSGTAWEAGYAFGKGKKVYQVCCGDDCDYSLMMMNGCSHVITLDDLRKGILPEKEERLAEIVQK